VRKGLLRQVWGRGRRPLLLLPLLLRWALGGFVWSGGEQGSQGSNGATPFGQYPGPLPRTRFRLRMCPWLPHMSFVNCASSAAWVAVAPRGGAASVGEAAVAVAADGCVVVGFGSQPCCWFPAAHNINILFQETHILLPHYMLDYPTYLFHTYYVLYRHIHCSIQHHPLQRVLLLFYTLLQRYLLSSMLGASSHITIYASQYHIVELGSLPPGSGGPFSFFCPWQIALMPDSGCQRGKGEFYLLCRLGRNINLTTH
jgi:hypothetical protein